MQLTIFTATYDRAELLPRLFASIERQIAVGAADVEWLIVDDGSSDATPDVLAAFAAARPDLVRYERTANGGKHRAVNLGARLARGDWMFIVDSDDVVSEGAIGDVLETISDPRITSDVAVLRSPHRTGSKPVVQFDIPTNPCHHYEWIARQRSFDTSEAYRVATLRRYPFSDWPGERFQAESVVRFRIGAHFRTLFIARPWVECEYQPDGLSANSRRIRANSPLSACDVYAEFFSAPLPAIVRSRAAANWWRYRFHARRRGPTPPTRVRPPSIFALPGLALFLMDRVVLG